MSQNSSLSCKKCQQMWRKYWAAIVSINKSTNRYHLVEQILIMMIMFYPPALLEKRYYVCVQMVTSHSPQGIDHRDCLFWVKYYLNDIRPTDFPDSRIHNCCVLGKKQEYTNSFCNKGSRQIMECLRCVGKCFVFFWLKFNSPSSGKWFFLNQLFRLDEVVSWFNGFLLWNTMRCKRRLLGIFKTRVKKHLYS